MQTLGREAPEAALVEVVRREATGPDDEKEQGAELLIIEPLKNGQGQTPGRRITVWMDPELIVGASGDDAHVVAGDRYIVAFYDYHSELMGLDVKAVIPATSSNLLLFAKGVAEDPSVGEPYNWRSYPPYCYGC